QLLDRVETPTDRGRVEERIEQPLAQAASAHRREGVVEDAEQRAAPLPGERLEQLQVATGSAVELEDAVERVGLDGSPVPGPTPVRGVEIGEDAGGGATGRIPRR